jgi:ketosteroid isomerase-like protein
VTIDDFAHEWIGAWNSRDLERILAHYADDVVFRSPMAAKVLPGTGRVAEGIAAYAASE